MTVVRLHVTVSTLGCRPVRGIGWETEPRYSPLQTVPSCPPASCEPRLSKAYTPCGTHHVTRTLPGRPSSPNARRALGVHRAPAP